MPESIKKSYWRDPMIVFARIWGWVAVPVVLALFVGSWLDEKFGTKPWLFLATMALAFLVTVLGIMKEVNRYIRMNTDGKSTDTK